MPVYFFYFTIEQQYDIISIFPIRFSLKFSNIYFLKLQKGWTSRKVQSIHIAV